jgi:hypothetical protein
VWGLYEWLTLRDAAARLGVSSHQVRKLIKAGILTSGQIMPDAPHRSGPLTSTASMSPSRWREKAARVGSIPKIKSQCFQTIEKEMHNDWVIAAGRMAFSAALFDISNLPSSR